MKNGPSLATVLLFQVLDKFSVVLARITNLSTVEPGYPHHINANLPCHLGAVHRG